MKKNNKKGFTLVELLAIIVILLAISVVAIPSISAGIERTKLKTDAAKEKVLIAHAEIYFSEHPNDVCISIRDLKSAMSLTDEETKGEIENFENGSIKKISSTNFKYIKDSQTC